MNNEEKLQRLSKRYSASARPMQAPKGPGNGPRGQRGANMRSGGKPKNVMPAVKRILSYLAKDKYKLIIAFACVLVGSITSLAGAYMLRPIINTFIEPSDGVYNMKGFALALCTMGLVYLISVACTYAQSRLMISISQHAVCKIREDLFNKMQKLPIRFFDKNTHGELMSRYTNDVDTVGEMLNNTIVHLFQGILTIIGTLSLMLYTNIWLSLVTLVMMPVFAKVATTIAKRSRRFFSAQQAALGAMNGYIEEIVTGQKVVKVFNHEEEATDDFALLNYDLKKKQIRAQFAGGVMGPLMGNLSQINYALTAAVGGALCLVGRFDIGGLAVFVNYSRQFSRPINEISMQVTNIFSALAGAERVFAVMDTEAEPDLEGKISDVTINGEVTMEDVTFGYDNDRDILKNINLYAKKGQKIAFVGSTGAGKTTVTNLINRFYDIEKGSIKVDGKDIREYNKEFLRNNIAMVLQDTHLFTGTVMENIRYGRLDATDDEVIEAAKTASAHSFIMRLPKGYDTVLTGDGANLSQGQRQLINIARASISKAPILVLDEATSSVDTRTEKHIEKGMDRLMKDRTTFIIAHRLSTIRNADCIMVLEDGVIIERGTHDELLENKGRYYELHSGMAELD